MAHIPDQYERIVRQHQQNPPVRVSAIARDLDIVVKVTDLSDDISGCLYYDQELQKWKILVNRRHTKERQRFTVAHEIAHWMVHRENLSNKEVKDDAFYRSTLSDRIEQEANQLAADILMPWTAIRKLTTEGVRTPEQLAENLHVSLPAISARLGLPT